MSNASNGKAGGLLAKIIVPVVAALVGGLLHYAGSSYLESERRYLSTKREQLEKFFAPMEMLVRVNAKEFKRYTAANTTEHDRSFIEQNVWFPNNTEIKAIIMNNGHLLDEVPDEIVDLLLHINVWLSQYDLIYAQGKAKPPVFTAHKGHAWPKGVDDYIIGRAQDLRTALRD